jgi:TRAP-type mannitol/chloroaromatic compound transport system substrate-binding protein
MDANMVLAWHNYGGGKELLDGSSSFRVERNTDNRPP